MDKTPNHEIVILRPVGIDDMTEIASLLRSNRTVICSFTACSKSDIQRIIDFMAGTLYALDGEILEVDNDVFVMTPRSITLTDGVEQPRDAGYDSYAYYETTDSDAADEYLLSEASAYA